MPYEDKLTDEEIWASLSKKLLGQRIRRQHDQINTRVKVKMRCHDV